MIVWVVTAQAGFAEASGLLINPQEQLRYYLGIEMAFGLDKSYRRWEGGMS